MSSKRIQFKHVTYLWNETEASNLTGDEVALLVYRSNLLGADLRITNYGGGNTSCKTMAVDPLTGEETEIMWVKGSGGDLETMKKSGLAALYLERLRNLKNVYHGVEHEDERWWNCSTIASLTLALKPLLLTHPSMGFFLSNT